MLFEQLQVKPALVCTQNQTRLSFLLPEKDNRLIPNVAIYDPLKSFICITRYMELETSIYLAIIMKH
jgi:hypothetical protein